MPQPSLLLYRASVSTHGVGSASTGWFPACLTYLGLSLSSRFRPFSPWLVNLPGPWQPQLSIIMDTPSGLKVLTYSRVDGKNSTETQQMPSGGHFVINSHLLQTPMTKACAASCVTVGRHMAG